MTRARYLALSAAAVLGIAAASLDPRTPKLVWNASASVPVGLYRIVPAGRLATGDLVAVRPPAHLATFMVARGYVGPDVPILKRIMGFPGQRLCRKGRTVTIDDMPLGTARKRDSRGRALPDWQGCRRIATDEIFLMNPAAGDSLDGRYFGPFPASAVIGRAIPIFTGEDGDGRLPWRADAVTARPSHFTAQKRRPSP